MDNLPRDRYSRYDQETLTPPLEGAARATFAGGAAPAEARLESSRYITTARQDAHICKQSDIPNMKYGFYGLSYNKRELYYLILGVFHCPGRHHRKALWYCTAQAVAMPGSKQNKTAATTNAMLHSHSSSSRTYAVPSLSSYHRPCIQPLSHRAPRALECLFIRISLLLPPV